MTLACFPPFVKGAWWDKSPFQPPIVWALFITSLNRLDISETWFHFPLTMGVLTGNGTPENAEPQGVME